MRWCDDRGTRLVCDLCGAHQLTDRWPTSVLRVRHRDKTCPVCERGTLRPISCEIDEEQTADRDGK